MFSLSRQCLRTAVQVRRFSATSYVSNADTTSTQGEQHIRAKLTEKFKPTTLRVQDVSGGCGDFYAITIASEAFKGLPMIKQHRLVTETLKKEIEGIHGLQVCHILSVNGLY
ncbi:bola-like protein [Lentinula edodes]|uniref:bola protein n=1 Tax=Lentinula edodes TaxID=5353 RepID=UPI001E8D5A67|nr:bola protein [Lentinula edodes]KAH7868771.1 bola protein [Lentinula edodes]KAJ3904889.1 bola-like protein [Lentinula edodes]KAJ3922728.1 bola-like protein [Lentinula edodes]